MKRLLAIMAGLALCAMASADFVTGFEPPDYSGSAGGIPLTGQQGWSLPSGVGWNVYTYSGNTYGVAQNPEGSEQFIAGRMEGNTNMARAEHTHDWTAQDVWRVTLDANGMYTGTLPAVDNLGSFSLQPSASSKYWQTVYTWEDVNTATEWRVGYMTAENPSAPGVFPGDAWQHLPVNHWFRLSTLFKFSTNEILEVSIKDLTSGQETVVQPTGWHLLQGTMAVPTAFRCFTGGGSGTSPAGNFTAVDNVNIPEPSAAGLLALGVLAAIRRR
jgi:hypothetical protein